MNLEAISQAYVRCVELDDKAKGASPDIQEDISNLRADLHALLMTALREANISFVDRLDASRIAHAVAHRLMSISIGDVIIRKVG